MIISNCVEALASQLHWQLDVIHLLQVSAELRRAVKRHQSAAEYAPGSMTFLIAAMFDLRHRTATRHSVTVGNAETYVFLMPAYRPVGLCVHGI